MEDVYASLGWFFNRIAKTPAGVSSAPIPRNRGRQHAVVESVAPHVIALQPRKSTLHALHNPLYTAPKIPVHCLCLWLSLQLVTAFERESWL